MPMLASKFSPCIMYRCYATVFLWVPSPLPIPLILFLTAAYHSVIDVCNLACRACVVVCVLLGRQSNFICTISAVPLSYCHVVVFFMFSLEPADFRPWLIESLSPRMIKTWVSLQYAIIFSPMRTQMHTFSHEVNEWREDVSMSSKQFCVCGWVCLHSEHFLHLWISRKKIDFVPQKIFDPKYNCHANVHTRVSPKFLHICHNVRKSYNELQLWFAAIFGVVDTQCALVIVGVLVCSIRQPTIRMLLHW